MLELNKISKHFGRVTAADEVSFTINKGEVVGFLGPNGAGKTTTMRMIAGVLEPDQGKIIFDGADALENPLLLKRQLGYLSENNPLPEDLLVREAVSFAAELHGVAKAARKEAVAKAIERTGLKDMARRPVGELSKGYRQRVGLAQAIVTEPNLLVLDEPTEGLDPNQRHEIRELITSLGRERTVLLSTHVLAEVASTCSRVIVIKGGRIVADDAVERLRGSGAAGLVTVRVEAKGDGVEGALKGIEGVKEVKRSGAREGWASFEITASTEKDPREAIFRLAVERKWTLKELHEEGRSLEEVFRELTVEN